MSGPSGGIFWTHTAYWSKSRMPAIAIF